MPLGLRYAILCLGACFALTLLSTPATAQTVLTGLSFDFTKEDDSDVTLAENQDRITPDVWLTRDHFGGIFNIMLEDFFVTSDPTVLSPLRTEWATDINNPGATIASENWESLTFESWLKAYGGSQSLAFNIVDLDAVVRILGEDDESDLDDTYLELRFTSWTRAGGGGFAYSRSQFPTGDYNEDGTVNAADYTIWRDTLGQMVASPGDGADGNLSGEIDLPDYDHWKARFGNMVPLGAGGQAVVVPEPSTLLLLLGGLLIITTSRKFSPRGPGQTF